MTTLLTILDTIEDDLKAKLNRTNGYNVTPISINRGIHSWDDFTSKPVVCFSLTADSEEENEDAGFGARWLTLFFYGYALTDNGDTDEIFQMVDDLHNFLDSDDFTYAENTLVRDIEIKEGGVRDTINYFLMEVRILYDSIES